LLFKIDEKINNILKRGRSQHTTSVRQEQVLNSIKNNIKTIVKSKEVDLEILAYNTKDSISKLDTLLGKTTPDEVLDSIFSNFCVGK
jgi:tRNA modification GTPase